MAWRPICESVKMPTYGSSLFVLSATWTMAASFALMIVGVSSRPDASMHVVILVGECIIAAPIRG